MEEKPAKRMRTDSGRATYAQPTPTKSKGKVQVLCHVFMYACMHLCVTEILFIKGRFLDLNWQVKLVLTDRFA